MDDNTEQMQEREMPKGVYSRNGIAEAIKPEESPAPVEPSLLAQEARRERRRRDDGDLDRMGRMVLSIPPEVQERWNREAKVGRWVRDQPGRQISMHRDDWDKTPDVDPVPEGRDSEGKLVLMEKYRDWFEADQRKKTVMLDEREDAIKRGMKTESEDKRQDSVSYTPSGNRISGQRGL